MIPFFEAAGNLVLHEMNTFWHNISWNPIYFIISCIWYCNAFSPNTWPLFTDSLLISTKLLRIRYICFWTIENENSWEHSKICLTGRMDLSQTTTTVTARALLKEKCRTINLLSGHKQESIVQMTMTTQHYTGRYWGHNYFLKWLFSRLLI